jgi:hypothetical protein
MVEKTFLNSKQFSELSEEIKQKLEGLKKAKIKEEDSIIFGKVLLYEYEGEEIYQLGIRDNNYYINLDEEEIIRIWQKFLEYFNLNKLKEKQYLFWEFSYCKRVDRLGNLHVSASLYNRLEEKIKEGREEHSIESFYIYDRDYNPYSDGWYEKLFIKLPPIFEL